MILLKSIKNLLSNSHQRELFIKSYKNLFLRIVGRGLSYLLIYIIIKLYGGNSFGKWSMIMTIFLLSQMISNLGLKSAIVRYFAEFKNQEIDLKDLYKKALIILTISSVLCWGILYVIVNQIAEAYDKDYINTYLPVVIIGILPLNVIELNAGLLKGLRMISKFSLLDSISKPMIILILILIGYSLKKDFNFIFSLYVLSLILGAILSFILIYSPLKSLKYSPTIKVQSKELLSISLPMFLTESLNSILRWIDVIILGFYCSDLMIGAYNLAVRLTNIITIPLLSVNSIAVSKFRELFIAKEYLNLKRIIHQSSRMMFLLAILPCLILILLPNFTLRFFDQEYIIASWSLIILAIGQLFNVAAGSVGQLLNMTGGHKKLVLVSALSTLVNIIFNVWLIPTYGITGAAISTSIAIIVNNSISTMIVKKSLNFIPFYIPFRKF